MRQLLKPEDVSRILNVSTRTLSKWRSDKTNLGFIKLGHQTIRYSPDEVEQFIASNLKGNNNV